MSLDRKGPPGRGSRESWPSGQDAHRRPSTPFERLLEQRKSRQIRVGQVHRPLQRGTGLGQRRAADEAGLGPHHGVAVAHHVEPPHLPRKLGMGPRDFEHRHGKGAFWSRLARADNFYGTLPLMADARDLFDAVKHLEPTVLTGLPLGKWAAPQKLEWVEAHFPGTPVITCLARDKVKYMKAGDVLVDDQERHRHLWDEAGGRFIHHRQLPVQTSP